MKYFSIKEMTQSGTAVKNKINNVPSAEQEQCLVALIDNCLDPARATFGQPVSVTSGFRCARLNKLVGGATNSQHAKGQAADLVCSNNAELFAILRKQGNYDQLIWEFGDDSTPAWVHVSYAGEKNRKQVLKAVKDRATKKTKYIVLQ